MLKHILPFLHLSKSNKGNFIESFVGECAVFFAFNPKIALLTDINKELIDLYCGIRYHPRQVRDIYKNYITTKKSWW